VPVPKPAPGDVLIEVSACGMNNTDVWVRLDAYGTDEDPDAVASWRRGAAPTLTFPRIQGADSVGRILAVGEGVAPSRIGERIMLDFSLYSRAGVTAGERVLITGASGGVGSGLIQLCRARCAIPYVVVGRGKEQAVLEIGAEAAITRGAGDLAGQVAAAAGGPSIDVVADVVAGPLFNDLLRALRPEGRYTTAGAIGGPVVQLDLRTVYLKHLQLHGSSQGTRSAFRRLVRYIEEGKIRALVGGAYKLSDLHRAQTDFMAKQFIGKLVVVPDTKWDLVGAQRWLRPT
jgi:NADPH:quinone reductase-like Zn-dependent oxidoreductase